MKISQMLMESTSQEVQERLNSYIEDRNSKISNYRENINKFNAIKKLKAVNKEDSKDAINYDPNSILIGGQAKV